MSDPNRRDRAAPAPRVLVVVLNWQSAAETIACLAALAQSTYPHRRVLVVDNGSADASVAELGASCPAVELLALDANYGYAGGHNRGIRHGLGECEYVWLLNPDVRVAPDCLAQLIDTAERQPGAGFLGPLILAREQPDRVVSAGGRLAHGFAEHRGAGVRADQLGAQIAEVDYVMGCALLTRRAVIEAVGLLDERYFLYHEEADWCRRARRAGFTSVLVAGARAWHPDPARRDGSPQVTYYMARNQLRFVREHELGSLVLLRHLLRHGRTLLSWTVRPKWRHKHKQRDALMRALIDFARGRHGEW